MFEMGFYLISVMITGYVCGSFFKTLLIKARYHYNVKEYGSMIFHLIPIPLIPVIFMAMLFCIGIGVEVLYIFMTGQL